MAKYLIRMDDACPTFQFPKWERYFELFDKFHIKPIIAVIPNNEDKKLMKGNGDESYFWELVRLWHIKGYHIAMHGYNHVYINKNGGILNFNNQSEFANLSYDEQRKKLLHANQIFASHGIKTDIFIAPSHSFDINTIKALKEVTNIRTISDGFYTRAFEKHGMKWIPCQLWVPKKKDKGIWTICIHPETSDDNYFNCLEKFILLHHNDFIDVGNVMSEKVRMDDYVFFYCIKSRKLLSNLINTLFK